MRRNRYGSAAGSRGRYNAHAARQRTSASGESTHRTIGAIASALSGRGEKIGEMLSDLDAYLAKLEPSLPALSHDLEVAPDVLRAYADAAPDLVAIADNSAKLSDTLVDQQQNLDAALVSIIGLADIGDQVLSENRQPLTDVLHLLVPTTDPGYT